MVLLCSRGKSYDGEENEAGLGLRKKKAASEAKAYACADVKEDTGKAKWGRQAQLLHETLAARAENYLTPRPESTSVPEILAYRCADRQ